MKIENNNAYMDEWLNLKRKTQWSIIIKMMAKTPTKPYEFNHNH